MGKKLLVFLVVIICGINSYGTDYIVDKTESGNAGSLSLDQAITQVNANGAAGPHRIIFTGLTGAGPWVFTNNGNVMPSLTHANVTIDGSLLPAGAPYNCVVGPRIILQGPGWGQFQVSGASCIVRAISFRTLKVELLAANITMEGCWFNLDNAGTAASGGSPGFQGFLMLNNCTNCVIGGTGCGKPNVISGAAAGASFYGGGAMTITNSNGADILNNLLGTNAAGTTALNSLLARSMIDIATTSDILVEGNVVANMQGSGTDDLGYGICMAVGVLNPIIRANKVGVNSSGTVAGGAAFGNAKSGIIVRGQATNMLIENNIICYNGKIGDSYVRDCGIVIDGSANSTGTILNNYIGVDASNGLGGNKFYGIYLYQNANGITIRGNTIGNNGNNMDFLRFGGGITAAVNTTVQNISIVGNYIGVAVNGTDIGNYNNGIHLESGPSNITIGGTAAADRNYICNNKGWRTAPNAGIFMAGVTDITIINNSIGISPTGGIAGQRISPFADPRNGNGIYAEGTTTRRIKIGGMGANEQNIIAYNLGSGIQLYKGSDFVEMRWTSLYCNGLKGIDINCASGAPDWGNNGFGCASKVDSLSIIGPVPTTPVSINGKRPENSIVDVFGTSLCADGGFCIAHAEYRRTGGTYTPATSGIAGTDWSYDEGAPMYNDISALATGAGTDCNTGVCRTSEFSPCVDNTIVQLPVTLLAFTATAYADLVTLDWSTSQEENNYGFEIERSTDGKIFKVIGKVPGNGTVNSISNYFFDDEDPLYGLSYYRLRQVDLDSKYSYSPVVNVYYQSDLQVKLYPNPTSGTFELVFNTKEEDSYRISIIASDGRVLGSREKNPSSSMIIESFDLSANTPGLYLIRLEVGNKQRILKVEKQ